MPSASHVARASSTEVMPVFCTWFWHWAYCTTVYARGRGHSLGSGQASEELSQLLIADVISFCVKVEAGDKDTTITQRYTVSRARPSPTKPGTISTNAAKSSSASSHQSTAHMATTRGVATATAEYRPVVRIGSNENLSVFVSNVGVICKTGIDVHVLLS